jgi:hypothetical protein
MDRIFGLEAALQTHPTKTLDHANLFLSLEKAEYAVSRENCFSVERQIYL